VRGLVTSGDWHEVCPRSGGRADDVVLWGVTAKMGFHVRFGVAILNFFKSSILLLFPIPMTKLSIDELPYIFYCIFNGVVFFKVI